MVFCWYARDCVFSPFTPSKWGLISSKEFKRKLVIRKALNLMKRSVLNG